MTVHGRSVAVRLQPHPDGGIAGGISLFRPPRWWWYRSFNSSNTLRLREFLTRNGHPYTYVDLDGDKGSQELLDRFEVKLEDIPVVISLPVNRPEPGPSSEVTVRIGDNATGRISIRNEP